LQGQNKSLQLMEGVPANSVLQRLIFARTRMAMVQQMCTEKNCKDLFCYGYCFLFRYSQKFEEQQYKFENIRISKQPCYYLWLRVFLRYP
jgi:hypothetical protein